jgi:putative transposase
MTVMQVVEQHRVRKSDPRYGAIDAAAFASKNLYNQVTYQMRQMFIHEGKYLDCYQALPGKVSNSLLILIDKNWKSFRLRQRSSGRPLTRFGSSRDWMAIW